MHLNSVFHSYKCKCKTKVHTQNTYKQKEQKLKHQIKRNHINVIPTGFCLFIYLSFKLSQFQFSPRKQLSSATNYLIIVVCKFS